MGHDGLSTVVTTHRHWDHHRALPAVVEATGARTVAGKEDAAELPVKVDRAVSDGDRVAVGECELEVIHLAGHTPGSIALLYDDPAGTPHLFTGDSLYPAASRRSVPGRPGEARELAELARKVANRNPRMPEYFDLYTLSTALLANACRASMVAVLQSPAATEPSFT